MNFVHAMTQTETGDLGGLAGLAVRLMEQLGAPGAGLAVAAENLFPPIPSEVILPLAGFAASRGEISLAAAIVWTTIGSVFGALLLYLIGQAFGRRRMYALFDRLPLVNAVDLERSEEWFARHGDKAVFLGRMVPLVRSLVSVPAGVEAMPLGRFLVLTAAGSALWNSTFVLAGYALGENWTRVEPYADILQKLVIVAVIAAAGLFVVRRVRSVRAR
ncbi:DedA family protein [Nocardia cyriacigeorgica]|uniref:DedA family protein n=1 Tax=Nocardia cyriacigeorgica TaxID=135487 RepID=A0A2L2K0P6_9NOCA|nr:DedA family protein [Nocardia cyriacigeorgica]AVH25587.1 DedA family protein [Nocardia cyriacigeorgica]MBF6287261.1 DedA family protein [Nocardia cyriacigeorgica]NEW33513.1 DedA family protein [Nocardia cyriacigeorgica]TLF55120.1 DedA family protein [Nocardia cyriacigeorgica]